jgi:hypothetical protein
MAKLLADDRQGQAGVDSVYGVGDIGPTPLDVLLAFSDGFLNLPRHPIEEHRETFRRDRNICRNPGA